MPSLSRFSSQLVRTPTDAWYRIDFGRSDSAIVPLLVGGNKSRRRADIRRAREHWADHLEAINRAARRSRDWNEGLAEDLRDRTFAREFLLAAIDEGVSIQVALGKVIRAMGVKEFVAAID